MTPLLSTLLDLREEKLVTHLPPEACCDRLSSELEGSFLGFSSKPFIGVANARGARVRKQIRYHNSFQTHLCAEFHAGPASTVIHCKSGMSTSTVSFLVLWLSIVCFVGLGILAAYVTGNTEPGIDPVALLLPFELLIFACVVTLFGRALARGEHDAIIAFLAKTLEAQPADADRRGSSPIVS